MNDTLIAILLLWTAFMSTITVALRIAAQRNEKWTVKDDIRYSEDDRRAALPLTQTTIIKSDPPPVATSSRSLTANDKKTQNPLTIKRATALENTLERLGIKRAE